MRDYVLTAVVFAMVPFCIIWPWIGILVWYWIGLMNPHRLTWSFAYTMPFAMVVAIATLLGALFARDRRPVPWNMEVALMLVLLAYFIFTTFFAWAPAYAWPQLEKVIKVVAMTIVATMFIYGHSRIRALLFVVVASIGFYGVKGGIWSIMHGGAERVLGPEGSFISGNTFVGLAINMVIPLIVALGREEKRQWARYGLYAAAALCAVGSIFTYSRGAWVGLGVVAPLVFFQLTRGLRALIVILAVAAAATAPALLPDKVFTRADTIANYEEDSSSNQRLQAWTVAWNVGTTYPFTGGGFEFESVDSARWLSFASEKYLRFYRANTAAHSIYFQVLGQHGLVAFVLFVWLLVAIQLRLLRIRREARRLPETSWVNVYATGLQIGLLAYLVSGAFLNSAYFDLAWLYFALTAILWREVKSAADMAARSASAAQVPVARASGAAG